MAVKGRNGGQTSAPRSSAGGIEGRHIAAWGGVCFASVFWGGLCLGTVALLLWLSVIWLMPPWVGTFSSLGSMIQGNSGLYLRETYGIISWSSSMALIGYVVTQGYQSAGAFKLIGIKLPASEFVSEFRYFFYGVEAGVNVFHLFNVAVGGFSEGFIRPFIQVFAWVGGHWIETVALLMLCALQTMASETMIYLGVKSFVLAKSAALTNAGSAMAQSKVSTADRPQAWNETRREQPSAAAYQEQRSQTERQAKRETAAAYAHGDIYQDHQGIWKYFDGDKNRAIEMKAGATIQRNGITCVANPLIDGDGWYWQEQESAPQAPTMDRPVKTERPQRRTHAAQVATEAPPIVDVKATEVQDVTPPIDTPRPRRERPARRVK